MENSQLNKLFLRSITPKMKGIILSNIADHYGMSNLNAEIEITEGEAEEVIEYVTGKQRAAVSVIYQRFLSNLKNATVLLLLIVSATSCVTAQKAKTVLCDKQTPNQFLILWAKQLGIKNPDTSHVLFAKPTKKHLPKLGDVIVTDRKTYIIIDEPQPIYEKIMWWKYRVAGQIENCRTVIAKSTADTKIQKFARLQNSKR